MAALRPGIRYPVVAIAAVLLAGCGPGSQQPTNPPTAAPATTPTVTPTAAPTAAPTSAVRSPTASATATASPTGSGKPSIDTLRAALVVYFHNQQDLSPEKAQRAAACAVYPSFQELSAGSLAAIVRHDPAGIDPGDKKVFGDVTTECVTAAG